MHILKLKKILQSNYFVFVIVLISILYVFNIVNNEIYKTYYTYDSNCIEGYITKISIDGNKITFIIRSKEKVIVNYYAKSIKELKLIKKYKLGDYIKVNGSFVKPNSNTNFNLFNYKNYLLSQRIYWIVNSNKIEKIRNNNKLIYKIKNSILNRINKCSKSKKYLNTFILGDNTYLNKEVKNSYQANGISHLFSISGMHVGIITSIILFILNKFSKNKIINNIILSLFLIFYMFLTNLSASIVRATIFFIILKLTKKLSIKTINLFIIFMFIMLIINPYNIYNSAFLFSYVVTLYLILLSKNIQTKNSYFNKLIYISFISFLVSFPIVISNYFSINLLSILNNLLFVPIVSIIIFPLSIVTIFIPRFDNLLFILISIMENISLTIYNFDFLTIIISKPNIILIIIYYILITLFLIKNKRIYFIFLIILFTFHKNYNYIDNNFYITYLDVGQGDCILIRFPNNKGNVLIDTGGIVKYEEEKWKKKSNTYSLVSTTIIPYIKSVGITKIDYLILTHGDYDHMGEAINLVENFKVENVILNCGEYNELEQKLIKVLDKKNVSYYSCIKKLNIDDNKLYFLNNKLYDNENDNSNVIYTKLYNYKLLFMGDAGVEVEKNILEKNNLVGIDILKVGHHGSKTSSSKKFIDEINPEYSIISVGKNNRYGHPNDNVLDNLEESKIYRTDQNGSIMFEIKNNKLKVAVCSP